MTQSRTTTGRKSTHSYVFILLLMLASAFTSCRTTAQISGNIENIGGTKFYIHEVKKGETLYSLSKLYGCDLNDISASNIGVDQGLREGQIIKIPVAKSSVSPKPAASNGNPRTHVVEKKETLFSVAKKYNLEVNDLIAANPGSDQGIKKGQTLNIPQPKSETNNSKPNQEAGKKITHTVAAGETLYGLSKKYDVTVESLQKANGGLPEGLKVGQEIIIPTSAGLESPLSQYGVPSGKLQPIQVVGDVYEDQYEIALMLPFYTTSKDSMETKDRKLRDVALQMYRGAMLAADTLESLGLRASLKIVDALDDRKETLSILNKGQLNEADVIIGPIFREPLTETCQWAASRGVHVVCPVQQPNKVLLTTANMTKSIPGAATQWMTLTKHIYAKHKSDNIILINSKNIDDLKQVSVFKEEWKKLAGDSIRREIVVSDASNLSLKDHILAGRKNIVVVPTNDKKVISNLFRVLGEGDIVVYGTESWDEMEIINVANRNKYKVHYPQTVFIDYEDARTQKWIDNYRKKYKSEPGEFAFAGYDLMLYYGMGLLQFGKDFPNHLDDIKARTYSMQFDYLRTGNEAGFENQYISVIGTDNYYLIKQNQTR